MKMKILVRGTVPSGLWRYTCPQTARSFGPSLDLEHMLGEIEKYYFANKIPIDMGDVENAICLEMGIEDTHCGEPTKAPIADEKGLNINDIIRFIRTVIEWTWKKKLQWVDKEKAAQRAEICRACPMHTEMPGCSTCAGVLAWLRMAIPKDREEIGSDLKSCKVCKCALPLKIHIPEDVGKKIVPVGATFPENCWFTKKDG